MKTSNHIVIQAPCAKVFKAAAEVEAARVSALGQADVILAGGVECPLSQLAFGSFSIIRAMSTRWEPRAPWNW